MSKALWFVCIAAAGFVAFLIYFTTLPDCSRVPQTANFNEFECHKLYLSFGVLFGVVLLLLISAGLYVFSEPREGQSGNPAKEVFDTFSKILLPIATLVLGYYFGTGSVKNPPSEVKPPQASAASPQGQPESKPLPPQSDKK